MLGLESDELQADAVPPAVEGGLFIGLWLFFIGNVVKKCGCDVR